MHWSRDEVQIDWSGDDEYAELVEFYELCLILRLHPDYVDAMSVKEKAAAVQAYTNINKERG